MHPSKSPWQKVRDSVVHYVITVILGGIVALGTAAMRVNTLSEKVDHMVPIEVHRSEWKRIDDNITSLKQDVHDIRGDFKDLGGRVDRVLERIK